MKSPRTTPTPPPIAPRRSLKLPDPAQRHRTAHNRTAGAHRSPRAPSRAAAGDSAEGASAASAGGSATWKAGELEALVPALPLDPSVPPPVDAQLARGCARWARLALARDALPRLLAVSPRAPSLADSLALVSSRAGAVNAASSALHRVAAVTRDRGADPEADALVHARVLDVLVALDDLAAACGLACGSFPAWYEAP